MKHYETIKTEDIQGFHVVCSVAYEDIHPRDCFDDSVNDINDICDKIDQGIYQWFMVRVEAYKQGILIGTDYLGGNLYESYDEFLNDAYYLDMVDNAISEAKSNLEKLTATA
jgi:hypothetical protein